MAEIVVFVDGELGGFHTHFYQSVLDLNKLNISGTDALDGAHSHSWANIISSFVIISGTWGFYGQPDYGNGYRSLGPGIYRNVENYDIPNDSIQSIKLINP